MKYHCYIKRYEYQTWRRENEANNTYRVPVNVKASLEDIHV